MELSTSSFNASRLLSKLRHVFRSKLSRVGIAIVVFFIVLMVFGSFIAPYSLSEISTKNSPPTFMHPFGTDYLGHDILSQLIYGAYSSMSIGILAAVGSVVFGVLVGVFAGYFEKLDGALIGVADIVMTFPALALLLLVGSMFPVSSLLIVSLLILILWPIIARSVRSQVLAVKRLPYVDAARMSGMSNISIIRKVVVPGIAPIAFGYFVLNVAAAIILVTALQFIGLGDPNIVSWGSMLYWAQQFAFYSGDWWWILAPGLAVSLVTMGFAFIGFSLEEITNPRLRT